MQQMPDGMIYVCPPTGNVLYTVDHATDEVTRLETAESSDYHYDFDDADGPKNTELIAGTLKHCHAIYEGATLVSNEELGIDGLTKDTSVRMAETTDGTPYLLICNLNEAGTKIDVYSETEDGWVLSQTKDLGEFTAESFSISGPRGGSVQDNVIDCIVYAADNDVYYTSVTFE
ncbi:MAG: hypothetical protein IJ325_00795 [Clostridia bacterium]|nr:hypothetical protein [Clostridia bacterium]